MNNDRFKITDQIVLDLIAESVNRNIDFRTTCNLRRKSLNAVKQYAIDNDIKLPRINDITRGPIKEIPLNEILENKHPQYTTKLLRKRLIKEGLKGNSCESCGIKTWKFYGDEFSVPLQLDHIDGNKLNNDLSNLRMLCANCHSLTPTFCGKNKRKAVQLVRQRDGKTRHYSPAHPFRQKRIGPLKNYVSEEILKFEESLGRPLTNKDTLTYKVKKIGMVFGNIKLGKGK